MTTRRRIGGVVLALVALAGFGESWSQGTGSPAPSLQMQLFEATKRTNELAVEQNKQTKLIIEQTNALADASVKQSAEAEQTRQLAEESLAQNQQALAYVKTQVDRTLQTAQARKDFMEKFLVFWSGVLAVFVLAAGYLGWREHRNMRLKFAQTMDEIRNLGLGELRKVLAEVKAERQMLLDNAGRQDAALPKKVADS